MHQLHLDIVFNILTCLPVKTLLRLRSVSKSWRTVIDSPDFALTHLTQSPEEPKPLLLSHGNDAIKFKQDENLLRASLNCRVQTFQGSCNGLLCFTRHCNDGVVVLFNPARGELVSFPPAVPGRRRKYGLGFDSHTNTYKEEFSLTSCPDFGVGHLVDLRGVLGVVDCSSDTHIEIWVLKEYENNKVWVREYKIHMNAPQKAPDNWNTQVIGFWDGTEILLRYLQSYFSYNPQDDKMRYRHIPGLDSHTQVYSHTNSLVSLSLSAKLMPSHGNQENQPILKTQEKNPVIVTRTINISYLTPHNDKIPYFPLSRGT